MEYLLDTDIYIYLLNGNENILQKIKEVGDTNIYLSAITVAELYFGIFNSQKKNQNLKKIQKHLEKTQIKNFNRSAAKTFGRLKAELKKNGKTLADMDLAIAAIAEENNLALVTHNTRHFEKIPGLVIEDWSK